MNPREGWRNALASLVLLSAPIGLLLLTACRPTPAEFNLKYACLHRSLAPCLAAEEFADRVADRTDGLVQIQISSRRDLGIDSIDVLPRLEDGTLEMAEIYGGHFLRDTRNYPSLPQKSNHSMRTYTNEDESILEIANLWGLFNDHDTQAEVTKAIRDDIERIVGDRSGGIVLGFQYYPSNYLFTKKPLRKPADLQGLNIRSHNKALDDLLEGMGATVDTTNFDSLYQLFESGELDAAVSCSSCGAGLSLHQVTGYLVGPMVGLGQSWMTINSQLWEELPEVARLIIREEAKRHEEVTKRAALAEWDQLGVQENIEAGMEHINLSPELKELMRTAALTTVLPNWVQRGGGADSNAVKLFNQNIAPIVKVEITERGEAREIK